MAAPDEGRAGGEGGAERPGGGAGARRASPAGASGGRSGRRPAAGRRARAGDGRGARSGRSGGGARGGGDQPRGGGSASGGGSAGGEAAVRGEAGPRRDGGLHDPPPTTEHDPLHGPADSPWVRYERLRDELGGGGDPAHRRAPLPDLSAVLVALEGLRALVPRELSDQVRALLRELLLTLRALIDWYLERLDGPPREPEVEEIPID